VTAKTKRCSVCKARRVSGNCDSCKALLRDIKAALAPVPRPRPSARRQEIHRARTAGVPAEYRLGFGR
jgi:hypothetical protein